MFFVSCTKNCGFKNSNDNFTEVYGEATLVKGEAIVIGLQKRNNVFNKIWDRIFVAFAGANPAFNSQACGKGEVSKGVYSVPLRCSSIDMEFVVVTIGEDGKNIQMAIVDKNNPSETNVSLESTAMTLLSLGEFATSPEISMNDSIENAHKKVRKLKQNGSNFSQYNFTCFNSTTKIGESIYIIGNTPELGNWDTSKAIKLNPVEYPTWSGYFSNISSNTNNIQWKCIKKNDRSNDVLQWQNGSNNTFNSIARGYGGSVQGSF